MTILAMLPKGLKIHILDGSTFWRNYLSALYDKLILKMTVADIGHVLFNVGQEISWGFILPHM
jgi:hypothetical protein